MNIMDKDNNKSDQEHKFNIATTSQNKTISEFNALIDSCGDCEDTDEEVYETENSEIYSAQSREEQSKGETYYVRNNEVLDKKYITCSFLNPYDSDQEDKTENVKKICGETIEEFNKTLAEKNKISVKKDIKESVSKQSHNTISSHSGPSGRMRTGFHYEDTSISKLISDLCYSSEYPQEKTRVQKPFKLSDCKTYNLESMQKSIEDDFEELQNQGYIFVNENQIQDKAKSFKVFNDNKLGIFYDNIVNQYDKAEKLVDNCGRVFFHIPGISDALITKSSELEKKYHYLIQIYRKWLSTLNSYEVIIRDGKYVIIQDLGNRSFIQGDTESYKDDKKFHRNYKIIKDNNSFLVVMDKDKRVYFSEVPLGYCKELESERIVENLKNTSDNPLNFEKLLFSNNLESTVLNHEFHIDQYNNHGFKYFTEKFNPKFLYCIKAGLPLLLHRFDKSYENVSQDIKFNQPYQCVKETVLFLDQDRFDQIANETNLLSHEGVLAQYKFCSKEHNQFHYSYLPLKLRQLQKHVNRQKFWKLCLSDSLHVQTDILKSILLPYNTRKREYVFKVVDERRNLSKALDMYLVNVQCFLNSEDKKIYNYFRENQAKTQEEHRQKSEIFNKVEQILENTTLSDLEFSHVNECQKMRQNANIFSIISEEYEFSKIIKKNPNIRLLELMCNHVLAYLMNIIEFEFNYSIQNIERELQQEKEFLEKEIDSLHTEVEKQIVFDIDAFKKHITHKCESNPKYSLLANDIDKLNTYRNNFRNENIRKLRKYEYIVSRLTTIEFLCKPDVRLESILEKAIGKKINDLISYYLNQLQQLEKEIINSMLLDKGIDPEEKTITGKILRAKISKELDKILPIEKEINFEEIFEINETERKKLYLNHLQFEKPQNTLVIYNHASEIDKENEPQEFCDALDRTLIQPGSSYCYSRSISNFNTDDLQEQINHSINSNSNIHIVGVNDGTADAQYMLNYIADILHDQYNDGVNYNGEIFIELYNPIGIADKLAQKMNDTIADLKLKNPIVVNIINEMTNKSIAVGKCFGIDFGKIDKKRSSFFIKNKLLNGLKDCLSYEHPHYTKVCKDKNCYYTKLAESEWQKFKQNMWNINQGEEIPTTHCMKRLAGLIKDTDIESITEEFYNSLLYDENLYKQLLSPSSCEHYTFNIIKDYLIYGPYYQQQIQLIHKTASIEQVNSEIEMEIVD